MATINLRNFALAGVSSIALTAATPSANVALPDEEAPDIMVINEGTVTVFVKTGDSTVTADATSMPVLPGEKGVYSRGLREIPITHLAAFVVTGTQAITIIQGSGA